MSGHFHIAFDGDGEFRTLDDFLTHGPVHKVVTRVGCGKDGDVVTEVERGLAKGDLGVAAFFRIHVDGKGVFCRSEVGHQGHVFSDSEGVVGLVTDHFAILCPADEIIVFGGSGDHGDGGAFFELADTDLEAFATHFTGACLSNLEGHRKDFGRDE